MAFEVDRMIFLIYLYEMYENMNTRRYIPLRIILQF